MMTEKKSRHQKRKKRLSDFRIAKRKKRFSNFTIPKSIELFEIK
jgi:hypothetical protein